MFKRLLAHIGIKFDKIDYSKIDGFRYGEFEHFKRKRKKKWKK